VYQWCGFKSRRGKNKILTALKSNSNTVWFNFQTYIYVYIFIYIYDVGNPAPGLGHAQKCGEGKAVNGIPSSS
jgi:hypothetical protein